MQELTIIVSFTRVHVSCIIYGFVCRVYSNFLMTYFKIVLTCEYSISQDRSNRHYLTHRIFSWYVCISWIVLPYEKFIGGLILFSSVKIFTILAEKHFRVPLISFLTIIVMQGVVKGILIKSGI